MFYTVPSFQKQLFSRMVFAFIAYALVLSAPVLYGAISRGWMGAFAGLGAAVLLFHGTQGIARHLEKRSEKHYARACKEAELAFASAQATLVSLEKQASPPVDSSQPREYDDDDEEDGDLVEAFPLQYKLHLHIDPQTQASWDLNGVLLRTEFDYDLLDDWEDPIELGQEILPMARHVMKEGKEAPKVGPKLQGPQDICFHFAAGMQTHEVSLMYYDKKLLSIPLKLF